MRAAIAGFHAETNTFSPVGADFGPCCRHVYRGDEIIGRFAGSTATIAGFLEACAEEGVEVEPILHAQAVPCGTIPASVFERLADEMLRNLSRHGPFDVVLLAQHGAAVVEGHSDVEAELIRRVRAVQGPDVIVAAAFDLHGNISHQLIEALDVAVGYRENPHRDAAVRGAECVTLALGCARGEIRPVHHLIRLPMVVPILGGWSADGAMGDVMADAAQIAEQYSLLSYTVFHGFGYGDVRELGSSVLAVADGDATAAASAAREIARRLWDSREKLHGAAVAPSSALGCAQEPSAGTGPVVLLDVGDNVGGGSPGDSTILLAEALERGTSGFVATLCDSRAARVGLDAGLCADVELTVGATTPVSAGRPLRIRGRITRISDGRFEDSGPTHGGIRYYDGGPTIRLSTGQGQELVISTQRVPSFSPQQLTAVGIEPELQNVIVAKGVVGPRAGYARLASDFVLVDTPGVTAADLSLLPYRFRPRPLWPLETDDHLFASHVPRN